MPYSSVPFVAIVDDHPIFLDGLDALFAKTGACKVIAKGTCVADAVTIAKNKTLDLIILDLSMPGDSLAAIAQICHAKSFAKVLVFTASTRVDYAVRALKSGASGYILKGSTADELIEAIRCVVNGKNYITPSFAPAIIAALQATASADNTRLTVREAQVAKLLRMGLTNREIAAQLKIGEKTVKHYMTLLMQKLDVRNRLEAVIFLQTSDMSRSSQRMN